MQALRSMIGGRIHDAATPGHDRERRGVRRGVRRRARRLAAAVALFAVCGSGAILPPQASAAATQASGLKAMWGPAFRNGVSLFPTYRTLGVSVYEDVLRWNIIARRAPLNSRNPFDPHYVW